jgi:hypothetical protein
MYRNRIVCQIAGLWRLQKYDKILDCQDCTINVHTVHIFSTLCIYIYMYMCIYIYIYVHLHTVDTEENLMQAIDSLGNSLNNGEYCNDIF